jgi:hypothetical protein
VLYPRADVALRHDAGVETDTREPATAYAGFPEDVDVAFEAGWLPDSR